MCHLSGQEAFCFFLSFFEVREIYPAIWYIFVNNGAPV